ncbi:MAG: endopeptidase La [Myxococcales bacterium]|nr:endopeptidase La [Myxococcales bacterium]
MSNQPTGVNATSSPFPVLPLRNGVLFPGVVITLPIGRKQSVALVQSLSPGDIIGVAAQRDGKVQNPTIADLHEIGTFAKVHQIARHGRQTWRLTLEGLTRFELENIVQHEPYWMAEGIVANEVLDDNTELLTLAETLREHIESLTTENGGALSQALIEGDTPSQFADRVAAAMGLAAEKEVMVLTELNVADRLRLLARFLGEAETMREVKKNIEAEVRKSLSRNQREAILREQLKAINKELGNGGGPEGDVERLRASLEDITLPDEAQEVVDRELTRMASLNPGQPEYNVIRTYLEWIAALPWDKRAEVADDLNHVAETLDGDHYGLDDVKQRILEHMAVLKLSGNPRGTILCLVGPPGVGKTSLGQSVADATGRPFVRIALGGVRDEAEIRGHRRTYIGALPGRIISALRKVEVKNPLILLDEIDKLGQGWMGSPEAALLEVLDPEQNGTFTDHYLELPFDLSEALFICTANNLNSISAPLRDRLEIVELQGYTLDEKSHIARRHLLPKQLEEHGIHEDMITLTDEALSALIADYTREAGVRQLKREIIRLCRALALQIARNPDSKVSPMHIQVAEDLKEPLGKARFFNEVAERTSVPGVATGLAWTPVGGDILFIETTRMKGKGRIQITGQLGDVMKESAQAALAYVRSNADTLHIEPSFLEEQDLHIHVPAGAVPKDGPSAGVTIFTALTSLLTDRRVRSDTAMTGECTLRGRVLPVGGIKAKVLAALRAGMTRVILPSRNLRDLDDVPQSARDALEFIFAEDMSQVLEAALEPAGDTVEAPVTPLGDDTASAPGLPA